MKKVHFTQVALQLEKRLIITTNAEYNPQWKRQNSPDFHFTNKSSIPCLCASFVPNAKDHSLKLQMKLPWEQSFSHSLNKCYKFEYTTERDVLRRRWILNILFIYGGTNGWSPRWGKGRWASLHWLQWKWSPVWWSAWGGRDATTAPFVIESVIS